MPTVATRDTSATNRLIKKFVASSPKSTALDALSHLLSPDSTHHPLLYLLTLPVSNNSRPIRYVWYGLDVEGFEQPRCTQRGTMRRHLS